VTTGIQPDTDQLRALLKTFNDIPPAEKTGIRRELRATGDKIIAAQRAILDGPLPAGVAVIAKTRLFKVAKNGNISILSRNTYGDRAVQRPGRSSGLRAAIKAALATRVVTGTTRQGISITTQNSKAPMSTGWNSKRFRHPVFGDKNNMVYQAGEPYFYAPVFEGRNALVASAIDILNGAMEGN
jgi:hypothetical protein